MVRRALGADTVNSSDFEALHKMYGSRLYRIVYRRLNGHKQNTEDIVQETFFQFCRSRRKVELREPPIAFLIGIAMHLIARRGFLEKRQRISYDSDLVAARIENNIDYSIDMSSDILDTLSYEEQLREAFARLSWEEQLVVYCCKFLRQTYVEAAAATGITVHMVEKHLINAKATLHQLLQERNPSPRLKGKI